MERSFWKIPKSAMTEMEPGLGSAFAGTVVYDTTAQFAYVMADAWERPDIAAVGTREDLSKSTQRGRFLRTTVRRKATEFGDPDEVLRVKGSNVLAGDDVLDADVPAVLFAGDFADDVVGPGALAEAAALIAAEKAPPPAAPDPDPEPSEAPAPEGP
jgi:hypothetical protein